ncbi:hypothetical protein GPJ56_005002 [Histomonas meleagridis]|uniref:uncharacterized protein n=1 Tax=Histomonas meleagridis TaxID=135588 RepID=UPI003559E43A|nr:hypothetical protein GPJ56_005002 [Histomonas meleagridis]KAH0802434.1 hypothetical protein GO595_004483 [Histomonas meleagridis]
MDQIINSQKQKLNSKKGIAKSTDSMKKIEFRLYSSPTKVQERNIYNILAKFDRAPAALPQEEEESYNELLDEMKDSFLHIEEDPDDNEEIEQFWSFWNMFTEVLREIASNKSINYAISEIKDLLNLIFNLFNEAISLPPTATVPKKDHNLIANKTIQDFSTITNHFEKIISSNSSDEQKIRNLEQMRNQFRNFRNNVSTKYVKIFNLSTLPKQSQNESIQTIEDALDNIIYYISNLKRQTDLLNDIDSEIAKTHRKLVITINELKSATAKSVKSAFADRRSPNEIKKRCISTPSRDTLSPLLDGDDDKAREVKIKQLGKNFSLDRKVFDPEIDRFKKSVKRNTRSSDEEMDFDSYQPTPILKNANQKDFGNREKNNKNKEKNQKAKTGDDELNKKHDQNNDSNQKDNSKKGKTKNGKSPAKVSDSDKADDATSKSRLKVHFDISNPQTPKSSNNKGNIGNKSNMQNEGDNAEIVERGIIFDDEEFANDHSPSKQIKGNSKHPQSSARKHHRRGHKSSHQNLEFEKCESTAFMILFIWALILLFVMIVKVLLLQEPITLIPNRKSAIISNTTDNFTTYNSTDNYAVLNSTNNFTVINNSTSNSTNES